MTSQRVEAIRTTLEQHGQAHVLAFYDDLDPDRQARLLDQIEEIDLDALDGWIERLVRSPAAAAAPADLEPAAYYPHDPGSAYDADLYRRRGDELIRAGRVSAFCVAGGQATRLGWNGPKGTYPATAVTGKPLFRVLCEQLRAWQNRCRVTIPLYIMTSPLNDAATRAFFADNRFFGLDRRQLFMFPQGLLPSLDAATGKLLLAGRGEIAMNPDGHGGALRALLGSGAIEDMEARGIEHISYFQVDNPLVRVLDPLFLGLHAAAPDSSAEISSKMVRKDDPDERVGVFCRRGGRTLVIEYSDLPPDLARRTDESGRLVYGAGSIAVHALGVRFVGRVAARGAQALPVHAARRPVAFVDPATGARVEPAEPNAIKLETFVFDAIPIAGSSIVYEASRADEFAPIKNARGADSPATSARLQSDRAGAWLEARGVGVPRDAEGHVDAGIEISPLTALEPADLARAKLPAEVKRGEALVL